MNRKKLTSASLAGVAALALFAGACGDDDAVSPGQEVPAEDTTVDGQDDGLDTTTTTTGDDAETTAGDEETDTTTGDDAEATTTEGETTTTG